LSFWVGADGTWARDSRTRERLPRERPTPHVVPLRPGSSQLGVHRRPGSGSVAHSCYRRRQSHSALASRPKVPLATTRSQIRALSWPGTDRAFEFFQGRVEQATYSSEGPWDLRPARLDPCPARQRDPDFSFATRDDARGRHGWPPPIEPCCLSCYGAAGPTGLTIHRPVRMSLA
jgi:hypothetical protein